jgi:hypothetical protein
VVSLFHTPPFGISATPFLRSGHESSGTSLTTPRHTSLSDCKFNMCYTQIIEPSIGMLALAHLSARVLAVKTVYAHSLSLSVLLTHPLFRQQYFDGHIRKAGLSSLCAVSPLIRL